LAISSIILLFLLISGAKLIELSIFVKKKRAYLQRQVLKAQPPIRK